MNITKRFATQALAITLIFNTLLLAAAFLFGGPVLRQEWLIVALIGLGLTLALWFTLRQVAARLFQETARPPKAEPVEEAPAQKPLPKPEHPYEASAVQILSILQRKGRLIDFLQEDIQGFSDAQIGAAVRNVHEGCRQALAEVVELEPVFDKTEGSQVTVEPGFDANAVRLTGQVTGDPPFKGALQHRGWRVKHIDLPEKLKADEALIVAAAEVEIK